MCWILLTFLVDGLGRGCFRGERYERILQVVDSLTESRGMVCRLSGDRPTHCIVYSHVGSVVRAFPLIDFLLRCRTGEGRVVRYSTSSNRLGFAGRSEHHILPDGGMLQIPTWRGTGRRTPRSKFAGHNVGARTWRLKYNGNSARALIGGMRCRVHGGLCRGRRVLLDF